MKSNKFIILAASSLLLPLFVILVSWYPGQLIAGFLLFALLPGYSLLTALWPDGFDSPLLPLGQWLVAVAASYSLTVLLLMVMFFVGIPLNLMPVAVGLGAVGLIFTLLAWLRRPNRSTVAAPAANSLTSAHQSKTAFPTVQLGWLVAIVLMAALFRMVNVYYSDLHGDEADILLRAVSLVYGDSEAMLTHSKGPGEILILNAIGGLAGRFDEQTARLPYALAGAIGIGLIMLLGEQFIGTAAGRIAGLLAAMEGVYVSYARTAQYQSVVLMLVLAVIWCFYRFHTTGGSSRRLHALGSFILAAAFLFHFEIILLLPVIGYLNVAHLPWPGFAKAGRLYLTRLSRFWPSALIFITPLAIFYIPFLRNPNLSQTGSYLENRIGAGSFPPFNNLDHFFYYEALKYNSAYYAAFFVFFLALAALLTLSRALNRSLLTATVYAAIVTVAAAALSLAGLEKLSALLAAVALAALFSLVILSPRTPLPERTLWLWIVPPLWVYVTLVNRPGKHHYLFWGGLAILVGLGVMAAWRWLAGRWDWFRQPARRWLVGGISVIVLLIFAWHTVMLLLRTDLEYMLTYPEHKSSFYPTDSAYPYGTRIGFGYPYRIGWQVIGQLRRTGQLAGEWAGNDRGNGPNWYMLGVKPTLCYPRYVLQGNITFKEDEDVDVPFNPADFGYVPRYRIWGNDRLRMTVLEFDPLAGQTEPVDLYETARFEPSVTAADFAAALDQLDATPPAPQISLAPAPVLGEGSELKHNAPPAYLERAKQLNGRVALVGYDLEARFAKPGGIVPVTLYWQAQNPLSLRYKVFVHVISPDGQLLTQADDYPVCGTSHANSWRLGEPIVDRHLLKLPPGAPPGDYTLVVGMYEPELNLRLNYFDVAGNEQGNSLTVGTLTVPAD